MEGTMQQVLAIAAAAVALALLDCPTHAGCAIGKDQAISPEAIQLLDRIALSRTDGSSMGLELP
jgi:hypothetical protein